jgi:hypothetical protein
MGKFRPLYDRSIESSPYAIAPRRPPFAHHLSFPRLCLNDDQTCRGLVVVYSELSIYISEVKWEEGV